MVRVSSRRGEESPVFIFCRVEDGYVFEFLKFFLDQERYYLTTFGFKDEEVFNRINEYIYDGYPVVSVLIFDEKNLDSVDDFIANLQGRINKDFLKHLNIFLLYIHKTDRSIEDVYYKTQKLLNEHRVVQGCSFISNKSRTGELDKWDILYNLLSYLKLLRFLSLKDMEEAGFFTHPFTTFRLEMLSALPEHDVDELSIEMINERFLAQEVSDLRKQKITRHAEGQIATIDEKIKNYLDELFPTSSSFFQDLSESFVSSWSSFKRFVEEYYKEKIDKSLKSVSDKISTIDIHNILFCSEENFTNLGEIEYYLKVLESKAEKLTANNKGNDSDQIEDSYDEYILPLLNKYELKGKGYRDKIKNLAVKGIVVSSIILLSLIADLKFLKLDFSGKIFFYSILALFVGVFAYIYYLLPKKKLKKMFYEFMFHLENVDKAIINRFYIFMSDKLLKKISALIKDNQQKIKKVREYLTKDSRIPEKIELPASRKEYLLSIKEMLENLAVERAKEVENLAIETINEFLSGNEVDRVEKMIEETKRLLREQSKGVKGFWGKELEEIEDFVMDKFRNKIYSDACLPVFEGFDSKEIVYILAKPSVFPDMFSRITLPIRVFSTSSTTDIVWGLWGYIEKTESIS